MTTQKSSQELQHEPHYDLKEIERRAYRATFQDGLWDIYLGLVFIAFGLGPVVRQLGASEGTAMLVHIGMMLVALLLIIAGKKFITMPRIGRVKFGPQRTRKLTRVRIVLAASVVLGLVVFAALSSDSLGLTALMVIFPVNILVVMGAMAYFMDYDRLFIYAVLWALSFPVGVVLEKNTALSDAPTVFIVTGGIAVVAGCVYFSRFLRDYALPPGEETANGIA